VSRPLPIRDQAVERRPDAAPGNNNTAAGSRSSATTIVTGRKGLRRFVRCVGH